MFETHTVETSFRAANKVGVFHIALSQRSNAIKLRLELLIRIREPCKLHNTLRISHCLLYNPSAIIKLIVKLNEPPVQIKKHRTLSISTINTIQVHYNVPVQKQCRLRFQQSKHFQQRIIQIPFSPSYECFE